MCLYTYATDTSYKLYHFLEEHILKNNIVKNLVINNRHSALFGLNSVEGKKIKNLVYKGVQHFLDTKYKIFFVL